MRGAKAVPEQHIVSACAAGVSSIDRGYPFRDGFDRYLLKFGYEFRDDIPCTCPDGGRHGHIVECRWVEVGSREAR